jgi:hypothetical protein
MVVDTAVFAICRTVLSNNTKVMYSNTMVITGNIVLQHKVYGITMKWHPIIVVKHFITLTRSPPRKSSLLS